MKLATQFGLSALLVLLPMLAAVLVSHARMQSLALANERLSLRREVDVRLEIDALARLRRLAEYQRKYAVSGDPGYAVKLRETLEALLAELELIATAELGAAERAALRRFIARAQQLEGHAARHLDDDPAAFAELLERLDGEAAALRRQTQLRAQVEAARSRELRDSVRTSAWLASLLAAAVSLAAIWLSSRSFRARLEQFGAGLRAVAQGSRSHRLRVRADELGPVAESFHAMLEALDQAERSQADFISGVSHELRTPIVAMLETNRLLLDELAGELTDQQRRMLRLNLQAAERLSTMINDLLDLSRLESGVPYMLAQRELLGLTRAAVAELEARAGERQLRVELRCDARELHARCDPDRYIQVVQNLVDNAIKYTPVGGCIGIRLARRRHGERAFAELVVADSGPGVPAEERERVFEKFVRRPGSTRVRGVGLGLAICREIVHAHGGEIWMDDSEFGGAAVHVVLPCHSESATGRQEAVSA